MKLWVLRRPVGWRCSAFALSLVVAILMGCQNTIESNQIIKKLGRIYRTGDTEPFTGYVTGHERRAHGNCRFAFEKKYERGLLEGISRFWYPNGQLASVEPYEDGRLNGIVTLYYPNGSLKAKVPVDHGERGGKIGEAFWPENGSPRFGKAKRHFAFNPS